MVNLDDQDNGAFTYGSPPPSAPAYTGNQWGIPPNGGNQAGYMDLSYWISRGVNPDEIFGPDGQPKPGWLKTERGYEPVGASPPLGPSTSPVVPPTTVTGGGDYHLPNGPSGSGKFDYGRPEGMLPFTPYSSLVYDKFNFGNFKPTNREDLYNEEINPGFGRGQQRLQKQIEGGAAYQGMLRSGMTFDRLGSILGNNEESQFKALDDRNFRNWGANRENQFGAWTANTGLAERENERSNNFRFNTENASFSDMLSRWQQLVQSATQLAKPT
jgi:hypothetical protein